MTEEKEKQFLDDFDTIVRGIKQINARMDAFDREIYHCEQLIGQVMIDLPEIYEMLKEKREHKNDY